MQVRKSGDYGMMQTNQQTNEKREHLRLDHQWSAFLRRLLGLQKGKRYVIALDITASEIEWQVGELNTVEKFFSN